MLGRVNVRAVITVSIVTKYDIRMDLSVEIVDPVLRQKVLKSGDTLTGRIVCAGSGTAACAIAIDVQIIPPATVRA